MGINVTLMCSQCPLLLDWPQKKKLQQYHNYLLNFLVSSMVKQSLISMVFIPTTMMVAEPTLPVANYLLTVLAANLNQPCCYHYLPTSPSSSSSPPAPLHSWASPSLQLMTVRRTAEIPMTPVSGKPSWD